jgi:cyclohexanecarboxylate-CoA ligase
VTAATEQATSDEGRLLRQASARRPNHLAIVDEFGWELTYSNYARMVDEFKTLLTSAGAAPRTVVTLILPNTAVFSAAFVAARELGAVVNPVAAFYGVSDLLKILERADPSVVVAAEDYRGRRIADEVVNGNSSATVVQASLSGSRELKVVRPAPAANHRPLPPGAALLVFTSGSEGVPKGVIHGARSLSHATAEACRMSELGSDDVFIAAAPLGHLTGIFSGFRHPLEMNATAILIDRWDPIRAAAKIDQHGATYMHGPPTMLIDLVAAHRAGHGEMTSLRKYRSGGAALSSTVVPEAEAELGLRVIRGYGASETLIVTNSLDGDDEDARINTDGALLDGVEVEFLPGPLGAELAIRGATRFMGYLPATPQEDPQRGLLSPDEWFMTGDIAELVGPRHLKVVGRSKDIIVRGGLNISSAELEHALMQYPNVTEAAVVPYADDRLGERCCALLVVTEVDQRPTLELLRRFLSDYGLASFKAPERLLFLDELPKTATGKVAKQELKALVATAGSDDEGEAS